MCGTCGCDVDHQAHSHPDAPRRLRLEASLLAKNNRLAAANRDWLAGRGVLALNVMGAPGAGKTTLLERTLQHIGKELEAYVIEGDQETARDAERIRSTGCSVVQINTGAGCHLDAEMVHDAIHSLDPEPGAILIIENVGNLVCPALFDLGERARIVLMSVTEGDDKPLKYAHMFRAADLVLLTKTDLAPYVDCDVDACAANAHQVNPALEILPVSATRGLGMASWYRWLSARVGECAARRTA